MEAFWGLWAKGKGRKQSLQGTGLCQPLREQLENVFREEADESPLQGLPTASPPTMFVK